MKKLLIIDDDNRNIFALSAVLKSKGYNTITATSATEGIEKMRNEEGITVVLLDMMMPDMDGYEALHQIRYSDNLKDVPVVAVTAQAMVGDREKCLEAGANDYISKPVDVDRLLTILDRY